MLLVFRQEGWRAAIFCEGGYSLPHKKLLMFFQINIIGRVSK
jgi:hypothetical protein